MKLKDELPVDHRLAQVYRYGAGVCGLVLLAFGCLGLARSLPFFGTHGEHVAGLSSNGLLSVVSLVFAVVLIAGAVIGGNTASTINITVGALFVLSGFVNMGLMQTSANLLAFRMTNVLFSFVMGLVIATFGMYGRVSYKLPHDNPYWIARHPRRAEERELAPTGIAAPSCR
jgi:hypothetical protein